MQAAERLHVTQNTVSARMESLEDERRRRLFTRSRNGARLTASGGEFHLYAESFLQVWESPAAGCSAQRLERVCRNLR